MDRPPSRVALRASPASREAVGWRLICLLLALSLLPLLPAPVSAAETADPRTDLYFAHEGLRRLLEWATFKLSFDGGSMIPDLAAGDWQPRLLGEPKFLPGLRGLALLAGGESGSAIYPRDRNATLDTQGALALWLCPLEWTHYQGPNTEYVMTTNATFYLERQGPMHNEEGQVTRHEGLLGLVRGEPTANVTLVLDTSKWANGEWRLIVMNWAWPGFSISQNGGEFASLATKAVPPPGHFGDLIIGSRGGEKTLVDEVLFFRRPLSREEGRLLYEALKPPPTEVTP